MGEDRFASFYLYCLHNDEYCFTGAVILFTILLFFVVQNIKRRMAKIPEPKGIPIFGDILKVAFGGMDTKLLSLHQRFGDIFRLNLGDMTTIFVFGTENITSALVDRANIFSERPNWLYISKNLIGDRGKFNSFTSVKYINQ